MNFAAKVHLALLVMLASPGQAAAQDPAPTRASVQDAYVSGDFPRARTLLEDLLAKAPRDPDLLRRLALIEAATGNPDTARRTIDDAAGLAPHDNDIRMARANILLWQGDLAAARMESEKVRAEDGGFAGLNEFDAHLRRALAARKLRVQSLSFGQTVSQANFASGASQTWTTQRGSIALAWAPDSVASLDIEREARRATDTRVVARFAFPIGSQHVYVAGAVTPAADFKERWSLAAGAELRTGPSTDLLVDGRYAEYISANVGVFNLGLKHRFGNHLSVTARTISLFGSGQPYRLGGSLRSDYALSDRSSLFAELASYPDTEDDGTRQLHSFAAGTRLELDRTLIMRLSASYDKRSGSYRRAGIDVDLSWRFGR
ncbi:YaiO family outer membrane beta-barrel protein [Novosphingobium aquiterrae]|uniref:YaiO family outer membrane beta-barrel protein n=1 Tax=Novosphingobium aquiterrae TaxID=624388 RepID=A0ABV6PIQ6_9SPHN